MSLFSVIDFSKCFLLTGKIFSHICLDSFAVGNAEPFNIYLSHSIFIIIVVVVVLCIIHFGI